jgi:hypothetical protein
VSTAPTAHPITLLKTATVVKTNPDIKLVENACRSIKRPMLTKKIGTKKMKRESKKYDISAIFSNLERATPTAKAPIIADNPSWFAV